MRKDKGKSCLSKFKFDRFDQEIEEWSYYVKRFEIALSRQEIVEQQDRAKILLSSIGPEPFRVVVDSFSPQDIETVDYDELKRVLMGYYGKETCVFAERRAFALRWRRAEESVAQYILQLKTLAKTCEFGVSLEERLQEQLILGINESTWQEELIKIHQNIEATFQESAKNQQARRTKERSLREFAEGEEVWVKMTTEKEPVAGWSSRKQDSSRTTSKSMGCNIAVMPKN
ncbi:hypothetical protein GE061_004740 [Apolygus lucorum]|uniref:Retrotransposon gag domain-containing protein n=1 Tax=Apolygus lucorum TaxID=248454 RepID=A0A8S9X018_APOLU|nr:hypothetical protein GE061_004740 [Apolygus lucorum]